MLYLPYLTTTIALIFTIALFLRYRRKGWHAPFDMDFRHVPLLPFDILRDHPKHPVQ